METDKKYDKENGLPDTKDTDTNSKKSLTNDEDADTDPNEVANKPSFTDTKNADRSGQFDGNIGI